MCFILDGIEAFLVVPIQKIKGGAFITEKGACCSGELESVSCVGGHLW